MTSRPHLYWSQAILLIAVVVPLAIAERQWIFAGAAMAAIVTSAYRHLARRPPLLTVRMSHGIVLAAFAVLLIEMGVLGGIPVVALSHFLILVCACRLMQEQSIREQGQYFVLCLLLLVVVAIVSGDILFPFVVLTFSVVGLNALVRFHLSVEQRRAERHNHLHGGRALSAGTGECGSTIGPLAAMNLLVAGVAASLFVLVPRVGAGMLGRLEGQSVSHSVTGLGRTLSFNRIGGIRLSDEQVMTVRTDDEFGQTLGPEQGEPYFRGAVFDQYGRRSPPRGRFWEWRPANPGNMAPPDVLCQLQEDRGVITLFPNVESITDTPLVTQRYWLPTDEHYVLHAMYPALTIRSRQLMEARKRIGDQSLHVYLPRPTTLHYEVVTARTVSRRMVQMLEKERAAEGVEPDVSLPDPPLPREAEVRALIASIDERAGTRGPLDDPVGRRRFVDAVEGYLHSSAFSYSLEPTPVQYGREPIGDFILSERRGHCEYFASALVLICQYRGIPARLVTGYLGGDYNALGGYYVVRQRHAHAWAEVYLPGEDWVRYDPTPWAGRRASAQSSGLGIWKYVDYLQFHWSHQVVGFDDDVRQALITRFTDWLKKPAGYQPTWHGTVLAFFSEMIFWRAQLSVRDRLLYYAFTGMALTLVVLVAYVAAAVIRMLAFALVRRLVHDRKRETAVEAEFYVRLCRRLEKLGFRRRRDQTPAEFAGELAGRWPELAPAREVVAEYYGVAYGGSRLSAGARDRIERFLVSLADLDRKRFQAAAPPG